MDTDAVFGDLHLVPRELREILRWLRREIGPRHGPARREPPLELLSWGRQYLPEHFRRPPSAMHVWLAAQLDRTRTARGVKINVLGPRGSAKSTVATLAYPLRAALECAEPYIWIISDTRHQACAHLENIKAELTDNSRLAADYPARAGRGPVWRTGQIVLPGGAAIEAYGTGQRIRGRRHGASRPTLILCDDLQIS